MKKILTLIGAALLLGNSAHALVISTNLTAGGTFLLLSNRASVYNIVLTSDKSTYVEMFDAYTLAAPFYGTNYTNGSYATRTSYATNYVTSYIGYNGYTNYYTNAGLWTATITNAAATNALSPLGAFAVGANTFGSYNVDMLFTKGIVLRPSTNVEVIINYKTGQ